MTARAYASSDERLPKSTLTELFFEALDAFEGRPAFQRMVSEASVADISYREAGDLVKKLCAALDAHGAIRGDRVAILSENRPEWALVDYACLCSGVIVVPIYPTLTAPQVAYALRNSGAKMVFVSGEEQAAKVRDASGECPQDIRVVSFDAHGADLVEWKDFLASGSDGAATWSDEAFRTRALQAEPDDVATILYTSGTTGEPKGVMLTHDNIASNVRASRMVLEVGSSDNTVSFLPLSHILQRMVDYLFFWVGCTIAYPRSMSTLVDDLRILRPTIVVSVPRIYEKIYNGVMDARGLKKRIVAWATRVADRSVELRLAGKTPSGWLALEYGLADRLVFSKVRAAIGGRLRFFVSGGGPLAPALNRFFYSIGLTILEGYGLTETSPVTNVNTLRDFRIGTVGKPVPGTEIRIAGDGEIWVRGPQVMKGYYNRPEATAAAIDAEGWFATGDIGVIDQDGFLSITDRKKDIIVTAGGKNIAPQPIENRLKTYPLVEQAVMIGDRRKYCVLLIVPAFSALESWARDRGIAWSDRSELLRDPRVLSYMESETLGRLTDLASFEKPKKIALLSEELTIENGFLTPTLKVKRRVVEERLGGVIDALYEEEPADHTEGFDR